MHQLGHGAPLFRGWHPYSSGGAGTRPLESKPGLPRTLLGNWKQPHSQGPFHLPGLT